jgi:hypothetical protein
MAPLFLNAGAFHLPVWPRYSSTRGLFICRYILTSPASGCISKKHSQNIAGKEDKEKAPEGAVLILV